MIGKINPPPSFSKNVMSHNNAPLNKSFINPMTGSVIKVKSTNLDFQVITKEKSIYREVINNPTLASIADPHSYNSQHDRFNALGVAVTAVYNLVENGEAKEKSVVICNRHPTNQPINLNADPALTMRGSEYINQFLEAETPLDSTNYAVGLRLGSDIKKTILDPNMLDHFNSTWNIRHNMTS